MVVSTRLPFFTKVRVTLQDLWVILKPCTELLEGVLFANIRFHDTVSRGRLLNRFGNDFEGIKGSLADNFLFVNVRIL